MRNFYILILLVISAACHRSTPVEKVVMPSEVLLNDPDATVPSLYTDLSNNVFLTWQQETDDTVRLFYKRYTPGTGWTKIRKIDRGTNRFVNWADYPGMATAQGSLLYAWYLKKSGTGTYSYDIRIRRSRDGGNSWQLPFTLNEDGTQTEHGFVSMVPSGNDMYVAWLDGRNTESGDGDMTLRAALLGRDGMRKGEWLLDDRVCDCCQTAAAMTSNGPVVIYRDRSVNEFRDIAIVRFENYRWSQPQLIYRDAWQISGCPVNGPRIDARGMDLAIAWFTGAKDNPEVKVIFSSDGGNSFSKPVIVNDADPVGRTDIVLIEPGKAVVSWMEGGYFQAALVDKTGELLNKWYIGETSMSRASGFPQITKAGDRIMAVWRDKESSLIQSAFFEVM